jgi:putative CRISPR-associated protein (TIGR02619 family)
MQTTITTVGISLLTNRGRPWDGRGYSDPLPDPATADAWLRTADLARASAETHTWLKLGIADEPQRHRLLLVHTNTADGRYCAERLATWARAKGLACAVDEIAGLGTAHEDTFNLGLAELARKLAVHIENGRAQGGTVAIAATGGFKAEIAIANLVGALLGAPVHYIYDRFERLVTFEPRSTARTAAARPAAASRRRRVATPRLPS